MTIPSLVWILLLRLQLGYSLLKLKVRAPSWVFSSISASTRHFIGSTGLSLLFLSVCTERIGLSNFSDFTTEIMVRKCGCKNFVILYIKHYWNFHSKKSTSPNNSYTFLGNSEDWANLKGNTKTTDSHNL